MNSRKNPTKKRKKELQKIFEKIQGEKYVQELEKHPMCSPFEWVGYMVRK